MKKFLSLVIALALLLCSAALVSCGDKIDIQGGTTAKSSVSAEPTLETTMTGTAEETANTATTEATSETVAADIGKATSSETASPETTASESAGTVESREPTGISLDYLTTPIKGKPDTEYKISVFYSSAASTAKGLEAKISDGGGMVSWTWKVGARTKEGDFKIVISGGGETFTTYFRVTH